MPEILESDPCRVLFREVGVNRSLVAEFRADPQVAIWWPEDDEDHAPYLAWLRDNQPGFVSEVEFPDLTEEEAAAPYEGEVLGTPMREILRFPTAEGAAAYVAWHLEHRRAWRERNAAVTEGTPCWCMTCGGEVAEKREITRTSLFGHIELRLTAPRFWCGRCGTDTYCVTQNDPASEALSQREWDFCFAAREHLGLRKGQRAPKVEGGATVRLDVDASTRMDDFRAALAAS